MTLRDLFKGFLAPKNGKKYESFEEIEKNNYPEYKKISDKELPFSMKLVDTREFSVNDEIKLEGIGEFSELQLTNTTNKVIDLKYIYLKHPFACNSIDYTCRGISGLINGGRVPLSGVYYLVRESGVFQPNETKTMAVIEDRFRYKLLKYMESPIKYHIEPYK